MVRRLRADDLWHVVREPGASLIRLHAHSIPAGSLRYNCLAPELVNGRFRARKLMHKYNSYFPDDATAESLERHREVMLKELLGRVGEGVFIEPPFQVDYGW